MEFDRHQETLFLTNAQTSSAKESCDSTDSTMTLWCQWFVSLQGQSIVISIGQLVHIQQQVQEVKGCRMKFVIKPTGILVKRKPKSGNKKMVVNLAMRLCPCTRTHTHTHTHTHTQNCRPLRSSLSRQTSTNRTQKRGGEREMNWEEMVAEEQKSNVEQR